MGVIEPSIAFEYKQIKWNNLKRQKLGTGWKMGERKPHPNTI